MPGVNKKTQALIKKAKEMGVADAKAVPTSEVFTAPWVRWKCQYGCGGYGQHLTCPPYSPTPEQTRATLDSYRSALLLHGIDGGKLKKIAVKLEREAFLSGYYKAFAMGNGPCWLCSDCALDTKECRHPDEARPAMEACGIDVFKTARAAGLPIEVVTSPSEQTNFYALVLLE